MKTIRQYETMELDYEGPSPKGSEASVDVTAEFAHGGKTVSVKGFYRGKGRYSVRFLPEEAGDYSVKVSGAVSAKQTFTAEPADPKHHGIVRPDGVHIRHEDGTWITTYGTTVYALAHQNKALIDETIQTLKYSPFNKVRMCVFPKHYRYNHNEPDYYPFKKREDGSWDPDHPCYEFWDAFESRLNQLFDLDIQVDLILFHPYDRWGFASMPQKDNLTYLDYLIRRFAAYPNIWWSLANEYDLCAAKSTDDWCQIEEFVAANDPYHHMLGNHQCFRPWPVDRPNVTHMSWQTKQISRVAEMQRKYGKPVMIDECRYEGTLPEYWGNLSGQEMTAQFWKTTVQGGYCTHGETFYPGEDEIVWWAKGGKLRGESPMRIAFLRKIVDRLPGPLDPIVRDLFTLYDGKTDDEIRREIEAMPAESRTFAYAVLALEPEERQRFFHSEYTYAGHVGTDAYLYYLYDQCPAVFSIRLPEDAKYDITVIDTWEMIKQKMMRGVSGDVTVQLPGKNYMAVLAEKV
ncbi:MAG: DUF5605 domain-containing protein [Lachnospiraceae bacterium]|jgi:hypothetical protein